MEVVPDSFGVANAMGGAWSRHLHFVENLRDDFVGGDVVSFCLICQADAVAHHIVADGTHIFRNHISALAQEGIGAGCPCQ